MICHIIRIRKEPGIEPDISAIAGLSNQLAILTENIGECAGPINLDNQRKVLCIPFTQNGIVMC